MTPNQSLFEQLNVLKEIADSSPYLSQKKRREIELKLFQLGEKYQTGALSIAQGEKELEELYIYEAMDEITSTMWKIGDLNPSSKRLTNFRDLSHLLSSGEISPTQARESLKKIMGE